MHCKRFIAALCFLCLMLSGCTAPSSTDDTTVAAVKTTTVATLTTTTTTTTTTATTTTTIPRPRTEAKAVVLQRLRDGEILFEQNAQQQLYPASTTKLLTALVALQYGPDQIITVTQDALDKVMYDASRTALEAGMTLTLYQLLEAMLLTSGCDASYVIAEAVGYELLDDPVADTDRAVAAFVKQMNITADGLGAVNSHFVNPDGYHHPDHYATTADLLLIAAAAYSNPIICEIVKLPQVTETVEGHTFTWKNSNFLLHPESEYYCPNVIGMKTGFTDEAGRCIIAAIEKDEDVFLLAVMGCPSDEGRWETVHQFLKAYGLADSGPTAESDMEHSTKQYALA